MHWMSLHRLAARGGNLNVFLCSVFRVWLQEEATLKKKGWRGVGGEGAAPPPQMHWMFLMHWMSLHRLAARGGNLNVFLCSVFRVWLQEEATLKEKRLEGGWGGGRSASPPDALDVFAFVVS